MRRPLIIFSGAFSIGLAVILAFELSLSPIPVLIPAIVFLFVSIFSFLPAKVRVSSLIVSALLCGSAFGTVYLNRAELPAQRLDGEKRTITATAVDFSVQYEDEQRVEINISKNELETPSAVRTLVYLPNGERIEPGDRITMKAEFYIPERTDGRDRASYYRSIGIPILCRAVKGTFPKVEKPDKHPLLWYPKALGERFRQSIHESFPERTSAFLTALLLGEKDDLSLLDLNRLRKAGLSHLTVVSGLHVGFLIAFLIVLFGRRAGSMLGIPTLFLFACMVGWSPSVLRACVMYALVLLAFLLERQADSINSLFAALLFVLILQPYAVLSVSLQLSFASTLSILLLTGRMTAAVYERTNTIPKLLKKLLISFLSGALCSVSSMVLTTPILLYHFGYLSVFAPLSNLFGMWAAAAAFPLGVLFCLFSLIPHAPAFLFILPLKLLVQYLWLIADTFARIPGAVMEIHSVPDTVILALMLVALVLYSCFGRRRLCAVPIFMAALIALSIFLGGRQRDELRLTCLNAGYGQAVIVTKGDSCVLIDCGSSGSYLPPSERVEAFLDWRNCDSLDALVLTSMNSSQTNDVTSLLERVTVNEIFLPMTDEPTELGELLSAVFGGEHLHVVGQQDGVIPLTDELSAAVYQEHFAVRVDGEQSTVWVLHSLTQKRIEELTAAIPMNCAAAVVSQGFAEDSDRLGRILAAMQPERLVIESGQAGESTVRGIPAQYTKTEGDITLSID